MGKLSTNTPYTCSASMNRCCEPKLWAMLKMEALRLEEQGFTPWILMLDADEFMEEKFKRDVRQLISDVAMWHYGLKFHHFWRSREMYRVDKLWKPSFGPRSGSGVDFT